jgi:hypothetical protein
MKTLFIALISLISFSSYALELGYEVGGVIIEKSGSHITDVESKAITVKFPFNEEGFIVDGIVGVRDTKLNSDKKIIQEINGQKVSVQLPEGGVGSIIIGVEGREYFNGSIFDLEQVIRADYEMVQSNYMNKGGATGYENRLNLDDHATLSYGMNVVLARKLVMGIKIDVDTNNGDKTLSLNLGARF